MKTRWWAIAILIVILLLVFALYRSRQSENLNVDPAAKEEIEKAKRR
jgi:uncharacterized integral membrane protein